MRVHDQPLVVAEEVRQFLKLHAPCGRAFLDTPALPEHVGWRILVACACGDTAEYRLAGTVSPRQVLAAVVETGAREAPRAA